MMHTVHTLLDLILMKKKGSKGYGWGHGGRLRMGIRGNDSGREKGRKG
jgi:hypothetical protein